MADPLYPDFIAPSDYSEWTYSSGWTTGQSDNSGHNSRKYATAAVAGETATCDSGAIVFTDAVIHMFASQFAGLVDIYVDGKLKLENVDCYVYIDGQTNSMKNAAIVFLSDLPRTTHIIKVVCKGASGPKSSGTTIGVNWITMLDPDMKAGEKLPNTIAYYMDSNGDRQGGWVDKQGKRLIANYKPNNKLRIEYVTRPSISSDYVRFMRNEIISRRIAGIVWMMNTNDLPRPEINSKANIEKAIKICIEEFKIPIALCTILPRNGLNAFSWNKVNGQIRELAMKYNLPLIDINTTVANNTVSTVTPFQSDGIHLDAVGDNLAAHTMVDALFLSSGSPFAKFL